MRHKVLWDLEIQTDHLISARRPELHNEKKKENLADQRVKSKESEKSDKYLDLARELKNYGT